MTSLTRSTARLLTKAFAVEIEAWRGCRPVRTFLWGHGIVAGWTLIGLAVLAMAQQEFLLEQILLAVFAAHSVWIVMALWRSSIHSLPSYAALARALGMVWAANAALIVLFLQLDLVIGWVA